MQNRVELRKQCVIKSIWLSLIKFNLKITMCIMYVTVYQYMYLDVTFDLNSLINLQIAQHNV